jgi:hypothetical protein
MLNQVDMIQIGENCCKVFNIKVLNDGFYSTGKNAKIHSSK